MSPFGPKADKPLALKNVHLLRSGAQRTRTSNQTIISAASPEAAPHRTRRANPMLTSRAQSNRGQLLRQDDHELGSPPASAQQCAPPLPAGL
jgi:hypothetical protein